MTYNPDYKQIITSRISRIEKIRADKSGKLLAGSIIHYRNNYADFICDWMSTYDPRQNLKNIPFILFPKQKEYIEWLTLKYKNKEDGLVEKSRDMGATCLNMAWALCLWLFEKDSKVSFGSRKEDLVDQIGDPDSIFEKGRAMLRTLPREYLPYGYSEKRDATFCKIINRENGSTITGESGDNIGRGGRSGIYFKDESAFYERPERIEAALSQNSDVKIDVSTPNGNGNPFYKKRMGGKIDVFIFDWRDDPRKNEAWYQKQKDALEPWILAQEVDRDYNASIEGICIPAKYVRAAINLDITPSGAKVAGLDVADEGGDANAYISRHGSVVQKIKDWKEGNTTYTARKAESYADLAGVSIVNFDSIGVGAGVKAEFSEIKKKKEEDGQKMNVNAIGVNSGSAYLPGQWAEKKSNVDMFLNIRALMWWTLRRRFSRTYEHVNGIKEHSPDDMISIPNHSELIAELSRPLRFFTNNGKIQIESKKEMKKRGVPSPNLADALCLAFYDAGDKTFNTKDIEDCAE
jgi:hypothetical protein